MSPKAIDHRIILQRDGQTQQQRTPQALDPSRAPVDERTPEDLYRYLQEIAAHLNFFDLNAVSGQVEKNGHWDVFFQENFATVQNLAAQATLPPHLALWQAFIKAYQQPLSLLNTLTGRHLAFYYEKVLQLRRRPPLPDQAHVVFELKKNAANSLLPAGTVLLAGKDEQKQDLQYVLTHDAMVNNAMVAELRSIFVHPLHRNAIYAAPVADALQVSNGINNNAHRGWPAFGSSLAGLAQVGFCLAAEVLHMKEGDRVITVRLTLSGVPAAAKNSALVQQLFLVSVTGTKGWIGPRTVTPVFTSADDKNFEASFSVRIAGDEPAITTYQQAVHGGSLETISPVLQVLLNPAKADLGYKDLAQTEVIDAQIEVAVSGISGFEAENDDGPIDVKKPFTPFGATPDSNASFTVKHAEAFSKRLKSFSFDVAWKNIPASRLDDYFAAYDGNNNNSNFTATPAFRDAFGWQEQAGHFPLFNASNAQANVTWAFTNPAFPSRRLPVFTIPPVDIRTVAYKGMSFQQKLSGQLSQAVPAFASLQLQTTSITKVRYQPALHAMLNAYKEVRRGMFSMRLRQGFKFKEYAKKYTKEVLRAAREGETPVLPGEPFAPEIQTLRLNYTAITGKTSFTGRQLNDYIDEEIEFFHHGVFGQMREHAFARGQHPFLNHTLVKLLPSYELEGELLIGVSGIAAGDSLDLLFQVAPGSANPERPRVDLRWSVLCDNYWKELSGNDIVFDTTGGLLTSGVVKVLLPPETTTVNTLLPDELVWIRVSVPQYSDAVCQLVSVQANAAIATFRDNGNATTHFDAALPPGTISKLKQPLAGIKSIQQPFASFGGAPPETAIGFSTRVSERLRHKQRSISMWDVERMILQQFPAVHKVKCISHAAGDNFYAAGSMMVILVPALDNQNAVNPFEPRVDKYLLEEVKAFVQQHSSPWVTVQVANPSYEAVQVQVKIMLKAGYEFNYYQQDINTRLQHLLSPWLGGGGDIYFGGKVTKSMIVQSLERLPFIDFITDLRLLQFSSVTGTGSTVEYAVASHPAAILVSASNHEITRL